MRRLLIPMILVLLASPAQAGDEAPPPDAFALLAVLEEKAENPETTWQERWKAYKAAKEAIDKLDDDEAKKSAEAAYMAMRPVVAQSLRRDELPLGGWIMGLVATLILWGGFAVHVRFAAKHGAKTQ